MSTQSMLRPLRALAKIYLALVAIAFALAGTMLLAIA
jgi:hypothetical protein